MTVLGDYLKDGPRGALRFDAEGQQYDATDYVLMDKVKAAQNSGQPAVRIDNFIDNADYSNTLEADHLGVFDPTNIRSRFARFDPRLSHLRNLSAAGVPFALGTALGITPQDERELREYLEQ